MSPLQTIDQPRTWSVPNLNYSRPRPRLGSCRKLPELCNPSAPAYVPPPLSLQPTGVERSSSLGFYFLFFYVVGSQIPNVFVPGTSTNWFTRRTAFKATESRTVFAKCSRTSIPKSSAPPFASPDEVSRGTPRPNKLLVCVCASVTRQSDKNKVSSCYRKTAEPQNLSSWSQVLIVGFPGPAQSGH